jgi:transposase
LIGDKAYDSDRLDRDLADGYGIEMIAPHKGERRQATQDGRPLRRYRRRWRVERLFAWLHHFRRLVIRWEYHVDNFFGMVRLGCMQILFRYLVQRRKKAAPGFHTGSPVFRPPVCLFRSRGSRKSTRDFVTEIVTVVTSRDRIWRNIKWLRR